jgi:heptosyltransferase-2
MIGILGSEWYKTYPFEKMAELLDHIVETTDANLLFNYIPKQKEDAKKVYDLCQPATQNRIFFDLYATDLRSFLGLLSQCDALIGNEGGSVNMAKALFIPTFSLFSPSVDKETWQIFEDEKNVSIHLKDLKPEIYTEFDEKYIKEHTFKYFEAYPIALIKEKLQLFFQTIR